MKINHQTYNKIKILNFYLKFLICLIIAKINKLYLKNHNPINKIKPM